MTKRPWTEGEMRVIAGLDNEGDFCYLIVNAEGDSLGVIYSEADARLFASAPAMYETLVEAQTAVIAFQQICTMQGVHRVAGDMKTLADRIEADLRDANPDAFTTPTVPASQPEGETK